MNRLQPYQKVSFDNGVNRGTGVIEGIAAIEMPVIGETYIVKMDDPVAAGIDISIYPYPSIVVARIHLKEISD
jgi:hypothetical protein